MTVSSNTQGITYFDSRRRDSFLGGGGVLYLYLGGKTLRYSFLCSSKKFAFWLIWFCARYEICSKLTVKASEYVKLTIKSLLLMCSNLNTFQFLLQCFYCWLRSVGAGAIACCSDVCAYWNQLRRSFHLWRNLVNKLH